MKIFELLESSDQMDPRLVPIQANQLPNHIQEYIKLGQKQIGLFRGFRSTMLNKNDANIFVGDPVIAGPRVSAATKNYYTLWLDNSPKWKKYPKRSQSFVCSTRYSMARVFSYSSDPLLVIPHDIQTMVGICPAGDFWDSFERTSQIIPPNINTLIFLSFKDVLKLDKTLLKKSENDWSFFIKCLDDLDNMLKTKNKELITWLSNFGDSAALYILKHNSYKQALDEYYDPTHNGFELVPYPQALENKYKGAEVWLSGKCYFIDQNYLQQKSH